MSHIIGKTYYGTDLITAIQKDNFGTQFHPEKDKQDRIIEKLLNLNA